MLPWRHFGWLPNLIGPSGCGTFFLHYGNCRCYRGRSPIERPADHWEEETEGGRDRETETRRENECYHLHLKWCRWSFLIIVCLISLAVYQLNHTSSWNDQSHSNTVMWWYLKSGYSLSLTLYMTFLMLTLVTANFCPPPPTSCCYELDTTV